MASTFPANDGPRDVSQEEVTLKAKKSHCCKKWDVRWKPDGIGHQKKDGIWPSQEKTIRTSRVPFPDKGGKAENKPTDGPTI